MIHPNRTPDALPEGASIAEALEALEYLDVRIDEHREYRTLLVPRIAAIRSALERAAAEGEAWRVIEEWCAANPLFEITVYIDDNGRWVTRIGDASSDLLDFDSMWECATRLEALQAAAEWIKAEAPAPPKGSTP
jgi:uncharacterized small protein (DUF1192 family)